MRAPVPLQMTFTMPWTPTTSFCHPLVQIDSNNAEPGLANYLTYALANQMTWQGLAKPINRFRTKTLGLLPLTTRSGPALLDRLKVRTRPAFLWTWPVPD
jgi:sterol 3beta-glucosyltransferase